MVVADFSGCLSHVEADLVVFGWDYYFGVSHM